LALKAPQMTFVPPAEMAYPVALDPASERGSRRSDEQRGLIVAWICVQEELFRLRRPRRRS
jgi:hypothetical protein